MNWVRLGAGLTLAILLGVATFTFVVEASGVEEPSFHGIYLVLISLPWSFLDLPLPGGVYGWYVFMTLGALVNWAIFWGLVSYATRGRVRP